MRKLPTFLMTSWLALTAVLSVRADGGAVRLSEVANGYRITVFTSPEPMRAGPADVSVLIQDAVTGVPLHDVRVQLKLSSAGQEFAVPASRDSAGNKLYQSAKFALPSAGRWRIVVNVDGSRGSAQVAFSMESAEALPRWLELWAWIGLPLVPLVLFALCERARWRSQGSSFDRRQT